MAIAKTKIIIYPILLLLFAVVLIWKTEICDQIMMPKDDWKHIKVNFLKQNPYATDFRISSDEKGYIIADVTGDITNWDALLKVKNLTGLYVSGRINDIYQIQHLKYLYVLYINGGEYPNLEFLKGSKIRELLLDRDVALLSLSGVENAKLTGLSIQNAEDLRDFTPSIGFYINFLKLRNAKQLTDLKFLTACRELNHLDISDSAVKELSPLKSNTQLEYIDIGGANVNDVSCLKDLPNLRKIIIGYDNPETLTVPEKMKDKIYIFDTSEYPPPVIRWIDKK